MNCADVRASFADLVDDRLSAGHQAAIRSHLDGCSACRQEWQGYRATVQAVQALGLESPPAEFAARVMARIEAPPLWRRAARWLIFPLPVKMPLHAAALVLLGIIGVWMVSESPELQRSSDLGPTRSALPEAPRVLSEVPPPPGEQQAKTPGSAPAISVARPTGPSAPAGRQQDFETYSRLKSAAQKKGTEAPAADTAPIKATPGAAPAGSSLQRAQQSLAENRPPMAAENGAEAPQPLSRKEETAPKTAEAPPVGAPLPPAPAAPSRTGAMLQAAKPKADLFVAGKAAADRHEYDQAIEQLRDFLARAPEEPHAGDALFLLADAYRGRGRFTEAVSAYQEFLRQYPDHVRVPAAAFGLGDAHLRLGDASGCEILRDAVRRYPTRPEALSARELVSSRCP